jgi:hypothetical protein
MRYNNIHLLHAGEGNMKIYTPKSIIFPEGNARGEYDTRGWIHFHISYKCFNMKQARPWMLTNLKIIWQFHAHPVHQKVSRFFGPRYIGDDFFLGPNLVSFNRTVVPYEISKVNFRVETKILVSMSEEI